MRKKIIILLIVAAFTLLSVQAFAATVRNDRVSILGDIEIDEPQNGDVVSIIGSINAKGTINGDMVAVIGDVNIESSVRGDVVAVLGKVTLGPEANIMGDVVAVGPGGIKKAQGARISGESVSVSFGDFDASQIRIGTYSVYWINELFNVFNVLGLIVLLVFGLLAAAIAGDKVKNISNRFETNFFVKVLVGVLAMVVFVLALPVLLLTIIGLPIAVIFYLMAYLTGFASLCTYMGQKILDLFHNKTNIYGEYIIGAMLIAIIHTTLNYSWWIVLTVTVISLGLGLDAWFHKKKSVSQDGDENQHKALVEQPNTGEKGS